MEAIPLQTIHGPSLLPHKDRQSRVSFDYFDPVGAQNLAERLRRLSRNSYTPPGPADSQSTLSDPTFNATRDDGEFDLEQVMRDLIRQ